MAHLTRILDKVLSDRLLYPVTFYVLEGEQRNGTLCTNIDQSKALLDAYGHECKNALLYELRISNFSEFSCKMIRSYHEGKKVKSSPDQIAGLAKLLYEKTL